jgi:beta-lactamase regulating signal transducer with metallopeptidase domain
MFVIAAVALVSAAGWLISLAFRRSAARRYLVLSATLAACLVLPAACGVRMGTDWTLLAIPSQALGSASNPSEPMGREPSADPAAPQPQANIPVSRPRMAGGLVEPSSGAATTIIGRTLSPVQQEGVGGVTVIAQSPSSQQELLRQFDLEKWWLSVGTWGVIIYAAVASLLLLRLLAGLATVLRLKRQAVAVDSFVGVQVLEAGVATPLAIGFGRSAIILPVGFHGAVAPNELLDVLTHEAQHLRRGDHWVMLLQEFVAAIYWPIVTVHLLNRALTRAREELCDNAVLSGRDAVSYGQTLLAMAERVPRNRRFSVQLAPSVTGRGELERRVAALLDDGRDRRTQVSRRARWTVGTGLLALSVFAGTTRIVAVADEPKKDEATSKAPSGEVPAPNADIQWTGIPKVDRDDPTLHRGVVLGPDGKPLAGASVYAASTIEVLELANADKETATNLGPVRAVTDAQGRFEFTAKDLSWVTPAGGRKRWETLLVATKEGLVPGWLKTWGEDRGFRDHWHPHPNREVAVYTRLPATLTGTLQLEDGRPLARAGIRIMGLMAPVQYDLNRHIPQEEEVPLGLFSGVDYADTLYRPRVLPGLNIEATTDNEGRFELPRLPEGFIAEIEVTHREAETSAMRVAVRAIDPVYRKPAFEKGKPELTLYGSGFTARLRKGMVLHGQVSSSNWGPKKNAVGMTVARANHNSADGMSGQRFTTDAEGRFEVTGLPNYPGGYELAFIGSFAAPFRGTRQRIVPGEDARVELAPATPYRLKLTDAQGHPIDRTVYSVDVQQAPGSWRRDAKTRFNVAVRVAPGTYEGIVPTGPAAVLVKRGAKSDRPAAVDPKAFFAPGRTDWTPEEKRYAYGDFWRIVSRGVSTTDRLAYNANPTEDQLELASALLTNTGEDHGVLELTAVVHSDPPVEVTLVDDDGLPVANASLERQFKRYNGKGLPATFSVYGLHPERAEFFVFRHEERGLIGTLSTTWTSKSVQVVMRPAATLLGRFVNKSGSLDRDFGARIVSAGVMPDTFVAGRIYDLKDNPGQRDGEFRLVVPPDVDVSGEIVRKIDWLTRPSIRPAFGPLKLKPGERKDLGDLVVP